MPAKQRKTNSERINQLRALLRGKSTMLIVMQDYPDPDAIASAVGLRALANATEGLSCSLVHGGIVGRAENRAMARYLDLNLRNVKDVDVPRFDLVALVDTQPGAGNNSLSAEIVPNIVIDHHPIRSATRRSAFTDIRSRYGATSTIIYEYLSTAGIAVDVSLATALVYGIRSDTQDLGRETTRADVAAYLTLYPKANHRALSRIETERVPNAYFQMLYRGLVNAEVFGTAVVAGLGAVETPDMIAEVADLLLRNEGSDWVLCYGYHEWKLVFSIRTSKTDANAGRVAHHIAGRKGSGGGHAVLAAGRMPLTNDSEKDAQRTAQILVKRFKRAIGQADTPGVSLVRS